MGLETLKAHNIITREEYEALKRRSVLELIGSTPMVELKKIRAYTGVKGRIFAKLESYNPGGSVKDRPAIRMIEQGILSGELTRDKVILDSTSGNTGIAYAMIGAVLGIPVELCVPANVTEERKKILKAFGAKVIYTDPMEGSDGAIKEAQRLYQTYPERYFKPDQYNNPENAMAHYLGTAEEVIHQSDGKVTHFVAGLGTTGTLMGTGRRLKEFRKDIQIIAVEPSCPLHGIEGLKHMESSIVPGLYDPGFPDRTIFVDTEDAYEWVRKISELEGIFAGASSGAALAAAVEVARESRDAYVVTIFPDGGDRYLSTRIWSA